MLFFFFSLLATLFGSISASSLFSFSVYIPVAVGNPFSGIIAFWPFIVALVLLLLAILWYQTIQNMRRNKVSGVKRPKHGMQSTVFLGIVTVFVLILIAAPYYLKNFGDQLNDSQTGISSENKVETVLTVHGMDCSGCESMVNRKVAELDGIESVLSSHTREEVAVVYDKSKVSIDLITQVIEQSGYTVIIQ